MNMCEYSLKHMLTVQHEKIVLMITLLNIAQSIFQKQYN